jgi:hypothetical protein
LRRSGRSLIPVALLFLVMATSLSVVIWPHVSSAAKIAFFCMGYGSGVSTGGYLAFRRRAAA